jgi:hypothetical protein
MTTLRFLIILLLVLNALAFSALRGWLGSAPPAGEPGRIASQLNPERIRLAREVAPPPAMPDAAGQGLAATLPVPEATALALPPAGVPLPGATVPEATASEPSSPEAAASAPAAGEPAPNATLGSNADPVPDENSVAVAPVASGDDTIAPERPEAPMQSAADAGRAPGEAEAGDASPDAGTEPAAEVAPPPPAADTTPPAVCHAWANLTPDQADRLSQRLRRVGATPIRTRTETPDSWWVRIPPQRSRTDAERRVVELNLLGVTDTFIVQEAGPTQHAVSLGVFKTEARARVLLGQLRDRGVTNAGIEPRTTTTYRIQASIPARELRTVESAAPGLRGRRQACAPR